MGKKCVTVCFILLNLITLGAGATVLGLGAWSMSSEYGAKEMKAMTGTDLFQTGCIVAIVAGCVVSLIALFGIIGVCCDDDFCCWLHLYTTSVSILLCLFIAVAIVVLFFRGQLEEVLSKEMEITLRTKYNVSYATNNENKLITDVWNKIQTELECCGVKDRGEGNEAWRSYKDSEFYKQQTMIKNFKTIVSVITNAISNGIYVIPPSCCEPGHIIECQSLAAFGLDLLGATQGDKFGHVHTIGCVDALEKLISANIGAIAGVAIGLIVLMILAISMAVYLQRHK